MTGRPNIDARLENWGIVMTGAPTRARLDTVDAWNVERAWRALPQAQRDLLYWCYIKRAVPEVICRKLAIPQRPIADFIERLSRAKAAIELALAPTCRNTSVRLTRKGISDPSCTLSF